MGFGNSEHKTNEDFWRAWEYDRHNARDSWSLKRIAYNTVRFTLRDDPHRWAVVQHNTTIVEQWQSTLLPSAHPRAVYRVVVDPWNSSTTRDRINVYAPGFSIRMYRGEQYFSMSGLKGGIYPVKDGTNIEYDIDGRGNVVQILGKYVPMLAAPGTPMHKLERKMRRIVSAAARACPPVTAGLSHVRPDVGGALLDEGTAWAGDYVPDYKHGEEARLRQLEAFISQLEVISKIDPQWIYSQRHNIAVNCGMCEMPDLSIHGFNDKASSFIQSAIKQHSDDGEELTFGAVEKYARVWNKLQEAAR